MYKKKKQVKLLPAPLDMEQDIRDFKDKKKKIKVKIFEEAPPKKKKRKKTKC